MNETEIELQVLKGEKSPREAIMLFIQGHFAKTKKDLGTLILWLDQDSKKAELQGQELEEVRSIITDLLTILDRVDVQSELSAHQFERIRKIPK